METSSFPSKPPTAKVRRNSCHYSIKNDVCDIRREFVRTNQNTNFVPPSIPQQTPPAVRVHLMQLVGRIGKRERSKGKKKSSSFEPNKSYDVTVISQERGRGEKFSGVA